MKYRRWFPNVEIILKLRSWREQYKSDYEWSANDSDAF